MLNKSKPELREILKQTLRENCHNVNMGDWECGSVRCMAGWGGEIIGHPYKDYAKSKDYAHTSPFFASETFSEKIGEVFGINQEAFYLWEWPGNYQADLHAARKSPVAYANIICEVLDYYTIEE